MTSYEEWSTRRPPAMLLGTSFYSFDITCAIFRPLLSSPRVTVDGEVVPPPPSFKEGEDVVQARQHELARLKAKFPVREATLLLQKAKDTVGMVEGGGGGGRTRILL